MLKRYAKQIFVYLESEADVAIYRDKWFFDFLDKIQFKTGKEGSASHDGCTAVIQSVDIDRKNGVPAFGIVDRDATMAADHWHLVWETNDVVYQNARPFGKFVFPTLRWEIENYLIEPSALEEFLANHEGGRTKRPEVDVISELLEHCDALVSLAACNAAMHDARRHKVGDGFTNGKTRAEAEALLGAGPLSALPKESRDKYTLFLTQIDAFGTGAHGIDRMLGLLRRIEGKALLSRIRHTHGIRDDPEFHLADAIHRLKLVPAEIRSLVAELARTI